MEWHDRRLITATRRVSSSGGIMRREQGNAAQRAPLPRILHNAATMLFSCREGGRSCIYTQPEWRTYGSASGHVAMGARGNEGEQASRSSVHSL
jgi:hypothetical protein